MYMASAYASRSNTGRCISGPRRRDLGLLAGRVVTAGATCQPQKMVQERELLLHQGTVGRVLALDLSQHPAQLGGAVACDLRRLLIHERRRAS